MKKDIRLINFDSSTKEFTLKWNASNGILSGRDKLVQDVVKRILTAKGSNQFEPEFGGNFYNLFRAIDYSQEQQVKEAFPVILKNIEESIITEQALASTSEDLRPQEKLRALNLVSIELDEYVGAWIVNIEVVTQDGVTNKFSVI